MSFRHLRSGPSTVSCVLLRRTCLRRTPPHYSSPWLDGFLAVYVSRFSRNDDLIYGIALRVYCRLAEVPTSLFRVRVRLLSIISGRKNYPHQDESKWDENNLISHYKFTETRTKEFAPSTIIINFVETARFTKTLEACESSCDYLLYWFLNGWKYDANGIPEVLKDIPEVKQLSAACEIAAFSPAKRALYNRSVMKEQDVINQLYYAKEEGLAEGKDEEKTEERLEIAKKMLKEGLSVDLICRTTGLSEEEVLKLKSE